MQIMIYGINYLWHIKYLCFANRAKPAAPTLYIYTYMFICVLHREGYTCVNGLKVELAGGERIYFILWFGKLQSSLFENHFKS